MTGHSLAIQQNPSDDDMPERKSRVLVVDDVADNRDILVRRLGRRGFEVVEATGGHEALKLMREQDFDVVLLDIMMPDLGGNEVLRQIRQIKSDVALPVIMVSAKSQSEDVVESLSIGANDYVTKPIDFNVALARIANQVARKQNSDHDRRHNMDLEQAVRTESDQRRHSEEQLEYLAYHDPLTGLLNRGAFRDSLNQALDDLAVSDAKPAVLFLAFNATLRIDAIVLCLAITAFWVFPFLLKRGVNYKALVLTSVVDLNFCILWSCYFYGGVSSPTLPWLLIIPILSLFYVGGQRQLQPRLLAISAGSFALFLTLYNTFPPPAMNMPPFAVYGLGFVSTAAALAYVMTMAIYYARIFDASIALETEVQRRRETADQLREAIAEADRAASAKAEFLARMSHEIKTPLNAVIGYSQLLREDPRDHNQATLQDINRIHDAGQYLLRLVNMILDLSKLEAGRMQFDIRTYKVPDVVLTAVDNKRAAIEAKGNSIVVDLDPELPEFDVDQGRFRQALEAVLENAGQHTSGGLVTVIVRRSLGQPNSFYVRVTDTGEGIDGTVLSTLFETFKAERDAAGGRFGGTGTNLTVVHRLCAAMGGDIKAESMVGVGSTFTLTLPVTQASAIPARSEPTRHAA